MAARGDAGGRLGVAAVQNLAIFLSQIFRKMTIELILRLISYEKRVIFSCHSYCVGIVVEIVIE